MTVRYTTWLLVLTLFVPALGVAEEVADWGAVVTPLSSEATFSFAQYDVTDNFTHDYAFSLEGEAGATYEVTFLFDICRNGCGNPDLSYGIYEANGNLLTGDSSTLVLSPGDYVFQVKGDGMGSGNSVDYWGEVTFTATAVSAEGVVAPVPEPASVVLTGAGLAVVGWAAYRRRSRRMLAPEATLQPRAPESR